MFLNLHYIILGFHPVLSFWATSLLVTLHPISSAFVMAEVFFLSPGSQVYNLRLVSNSSPSEAKLMLKAVGTTSLLDRVECFYSESVAKRGLQVRMPNNCTIWNCTWFGYRVANTINRAWKYRLEFGSVQANWGWSHAKIPIILVVEVQCSYLTLHPNIWRYIVHLPAPSL